MILMICSHEQTKAPARVRDHRGRLTTTCNNLKGPHIMAKEIFAPAIGEATNTPPEDCRDEVFEIHCIVEQAEAVIHAAADDKGAPALWALHTLVQAVGVVALKADEDDEASMNEASAELANILGLLEVFDRIDYFGEWIHTSLLLHAATTVLQAAKDKLDRLNELAIRRRRADDGAERPCRSIGITAVPIARCGPA
jgi:hypothetical protein